MTMTKTKKRILLIVGAVILAAVLVTAGIFLFKPKTTIASLLHLTSKEQITSVMLVSYYHQYNPYGDLPPDPREYSAEKDITDTSLARQYIDAIFEKPVTLQEFSKLRSEKQNYIGNLDSTASEIRITVANVGEDYPIVEKEFIISCNNELELCDVPEVFLSYDYTTDYIRNRFEQNSARGIQEELKNSESYVFTVPGEKLFTTGFIKEQLGVDK